MIAQLFICICFCALMTVLSAVAPEVVDKKQQNLQNKLNSVISETILQNEYLFPARTTGNTPFSDPRKSEIHSLCSRMQPNDPDRNRVGCCQHSNMKILYNVKLHDGKFRYMYSESNHSREGFIMLPVLNSLRWKLATCYNLIIAAVHVDVVHVSIHVDVYVVVDVVALLLLLFHFSECKN